MTKGITHSFSRKGNPYDNTCIESFHSVLKKEEIHHHKHYDSKMARRAIFEYIDMSSNIKFLLIIYQFINSKVTLSNYTC